jgi:hypothetical protein
MNVKALITCAYSWWEVSGVMTVRHILVCQVAEEHYGARVPRCSAARPGLGLEAASVTALQGAENIAKAIPAALMDEIFH